MRPAPWNKTPGPETDFDRNQQPAVILLRNF
jgi:hypothetical protein